MFHKGAILFLTGATGRWDQTLPFASFAIARYQVPMARPLGTDLEGFPFAIRSIRRSRSSSADRVSAILAVQLKRAHLVRVFDCGFDADNLGYGGNCPECAESPLDRTSISPMTEA